MADDIQVPTCNSKNKEDWLQEQKSQPLLDSIYSVRSIL